MRSQTTRLSALFVSSLFAACDGGNFPSSPGYTPPSSTTPPCTMITDIREGKEYTWPAEGALIVKRSDTSPMGLGRRFIDQPVLIVDVSGVAGQYCTKELLISGLWFNVPLAFEPKNLSLRDSAKVYVDTVDQKNLVSVIDAWGPQGPIEKATEWGAGIPAKILVQPGQTRKIILTIDTTFFEPQNMGHATLLRVDWGVKTGKGGSSSPPVEGNSLTYKTTLMEVCKPVEDKMALLNMPLSGWKCGVDSTPRNILMYVPPENTSCDLSIDKIGYGEVKPEQILSDSEFYSGSGQQIFRCRH